MKRVLIILMIALVSSFVCKAQLCYQSPNAPNVQVTVVSGGIMIDIDGGSSMMLFPQGFLSSYMYYASDGVSALFTMDLTSMLLYIGGQTYQYTVVAATTTTPMPGFNYPAVPPSTVPPTYYDNGPSEADRAYYRSEIRQLRYKIRDAERTLRRYERYAERDPSISSMQLVQSQRRLIRTYYDRLEWLESQLY